MNEGYLQVSLSDMIDCLGEERAREKLSSFSCEKYNMDVHNYLHYKSIEFAKHGWAATNLVFASYQQELVLIGYYVIANKSIQIDKEALGKRWSRKVSEFGTYDSVTKKYSLPIPLIGQIGKNYTNGYNKIITGDELLKMACEKVQEVQKAIGGKFVYLECENKQKLIEFYSRNGFVTFGERELDGDERDLDCTKLVQMLKYLS